MAADPTGKDLDKALELEEARLSERVRMRLDSHEDEDSEVIDVRAKAQVGSTPPAAKGLIAILNTLPPWGRVLVVLALLALIGASGIATKLSGLW